LEEKINQLVDLTSSMTWFGSALMVEKIAEVPNPEPEDDTKTLYAMFFSITSAIFFSERTLLSSHSQSA